MANTCTEVFLMNRGGGPGERLGARVVALDEGIDLVPDLLRRGEAGALEGGAAEDREPDLDLVHPGGVGRREVEADVSMTREPAVPLRLVGAEVVEHDMDLALRVGGHDLVHEVEELDPPAATIVAGPNLAAGDVEGGEQRRRAMALVVVAAAGERAPALELEGALRPLERLDVRLLVDREYEGAVRRVEIEADDLGLSGILCAGPVDHHARTNLSSNMMANWVFASPHSRGDIFHSAAVWRNTR